MACCLRRQIAIAIGCVKTAGKAVNHMVALVGIPLLQALGLLIFSVIWIVYAVHLASMGKITTQKVNLGAGDLAGSAGNLTGGATDQIPGALIPGAQISVRVYEYDPFVQRVGWFLLFCFLWTANFIVAMGDLMIALSVAKYYFTRDKWKIGSWSVLLSVWQVIFYHSGTCAVGSCLIALVQLARIAIAKAQREAERANSKIAQCILCCCQCCFACMEKCLKYISKNAYAQTAIFGTAFCPSCLSSYWLIFRNFSRISALTFVSSAVMIIGKIFIASLTTVVGYYFVTENLIDDLHSTAGPTIFIFFLAYFVTDFFMDVIDMAITTVLHCFVADEEMFPDTVYAEDDLRQFIDDNGAEKD